MITSALPYANGPIHIGHLVEYVQSDVFTRFLRLTGKKVIHCCADDTHGTPIEINAKKLGVTPEQLITKYYKEHTDDFKAFLIDFDSYYSTNTPENKKFSDFVFNKAKEKGLIYTKDVEHAYCESCKRFLPDRFVKGKCPKCGAEDQYGDVCEACNAAYDTVDLVEPFCTICKATPVRKSSMHYFFKLSALSQELYEWLTSNENLQKEIVNWVKNWIKDGLKDWDISRDGPYFGFKIPGEEDKYYYVWLDAPIGYIASTENYCRQHNLDAMKDYWTSKDCNIIHFIGKDIVYFHYLFWPALLKAADLNLPDTLLTHGFLTVNGEKMSKSRGTFLTARDFLKKCDPELLRFYFAGNLSRKMNDINLDEKDFKDRINNELVGNISNFAYRVLSFTEKNYGSKTVKIQQDALTQELESIHDEIRDLYERCDFREAVKRIAHYSSLGNKCFQENEPWNNKDKSHGVVSLCVNIVKNLCILLKPILPKRTEELESQLNLKDLKWTDLGFDLGEHQIGKPKALVEKIPETKLFEIGSGFSKLNIKVGKVLSVEDHPDAEKLYVLKVDLGGEERQLVAGLKGYLSKEEIEGKHICVVTNLEHAKLRGVESQGMLLAGEKGDKVQILTANESQPGDQVFIDGVKPKDEKIQFKQFQQIKMTIKGGKAFYEDSVLKTEKEEVACDIEDGAKVS